jgi:hypothetical protein
MSKKKPQLNKAGIRILSSGPRGGRSIAENLTLTAKLVRKAARAGDNTLMRIGR